MHGTIASSPPLLCLPRSVWPVSRRNPYPHPNARPHKMLFKTVHGVSEHNYHGTVFEPLFGTDQRSGASPALWLVLSTVLTEAIDRMSFIDPTAWEELQGLLDSFVDDTTLGLTDCDKLSYNELIHHTQELAQTWERVLHYSGGVLLSTRRRERKIFIRAVYYLLNSIDRRTSLEIREFSLPWPGPF